MDYNHIISSLYQIASELSELSDFIYKDCISSENDKEFVEAYTRLNEAKKFVLKAIDEIDP
jgi:hypothetical protein